MLVDLYKVIDNQILIAIVNYSDITSDFILNIKNCMKIVLTYF